jgi:hypothetical protein
MKQGYAVLILALLLAACVPGGFVGPSQGVNTFASNGERIYFTATSDRGTSITYTGGPATGGMMMGGSLTCAACHGPDGRGGQVMIQMQVINAPDIRWQALSEHVTEEMHDPKAVYDLAMFKQAIEQGRHPDGDTLESVMPRWSMSDQDVSDLAQFLKSLP